MAPVTGMVEWNDTGSLTRTGKGDKEGELPLMSMTSSSARRSAWGWIGN